MGKNKITTLSYFIKRFKDSGYVVEKIFSDYSEADPRSWTVIIDPSVASVFVTCYNNFKEYGDEFFELSDGGQYIPEKLKIRTSSVEVLMEYLTEFGINNKHPSY